MKAIDELEWISKFYGNGLDLKVKGIERITNFTFLWNMFEAFACGTWADYEKINTAVDKMDASDPIDVKPYVNYFRDRYFDKHGSTPLFNGLKFRPTGGDANAKAKVTDALTLKETNGVEVLKALLYILYRFRNNLFHGGKNVANIVSQIDNFIVANNLLIEILDKMKGQGLVNLNA